MKAELLKKLGLTEEQIKGVMSQYGNDINPIKEQLSTANSEKAGLQKQLDTVNGQLAQIKADHEGDSDLKGQIDKLQADNKKANEDYQAELIKTKIDYQTELALTNAGAKNVKAVHALIDDGQLKLDDKGNLSGLSEQLAQVQKDNDFLFNNVNAKPDAASEQAHTPNILVGGNPNPDLKDGESLVSRIQERLSKQ